MLYGENEAQTISEIFLEFKQELEAALRKKYARLQTFVLNKS